MPTLRYIADELVRQAGAHPGEWQTQTLPRGLILSYKQFDDLRYLQVSREGSVPVEPDLTVCRRAFAVPEGALATSTSRGETHPKSHRYIRYQIVLYSWREEQAPALIGPSSIANRQSAIENP